nr:TetR/AcrR family transcriptional regulator C-terminal domain-containing protein [Frankia sp. Cppng1_Ct_nod]
MLVRSEAPRHPRLPELWREHATTPVRSALTEHLARVAHAGMLQIDDLTRAAGQFVALVMGTAWWMTEFGT